MFFFFFYIQMRTSLVNNASSSCSSKKPSPFVSGIREKHRSRFKKKKNHKLKRKVILSSFEKFRSSTKKVTVQVEERFGVEIVGVETVRLLPHLLQLILTALKNQNTRHAKRKSQTRSLELA